MRTIRYVVIGATFFIVALGLWMSSGIGQSATSVAGNSTGTTEESASAEKGTETASGAAGTVRSVAERIVGVRRLLETDEAREKDLKVEFEELKVEFEDLSDKLTNLDKEKEAQAQTAPASLMEPMPATESVSVNQEWVESRDRLDWIVRRRNAIQSQLETLKEKIAFEKEFLKRLENPQLPPVGTQTITPSQDVSAEVVRDPQTGKPVANANPGMQQMLMPGMPGNNAKSSNGGSENDVRSGELIAPAVRPTTLTDERLIAAKRDRDRKQAVVVEMEKRVARLGTAIEIFERDLSNTRELLKTANDELTSATKVLESGVTDVESEAQKKSREINEKRVRDAREEIKREQTVISESEALVRRLHKSKETAEKELEAARSTLSDAENWALLLESPLAPSRLFRWFTEVAPKMLGVVALMVAAYLLSRLVERRIRSGILLRGRLPMTEHESRTETLRRVFRNFSELTIFILGTLAILDQAGLNVTVLLGGAAVLGAAIAFGSQNLIKDYFSGFMILIENQYNVGSVIRTANLSGVVEDVTLRITVLRDEEGVVHFIPHSQMTTVSNMTHGWSRAVFAIRLNYKENVDRAIEVLMDLAREMRRDPKFSSQIIEEPELQGVDAFNESGVTIKFLVKTRPLAQWKIKRELLRRIKNRFDEMGIRFGLPSMKLNLDRQFSSMGR